MFFWLLLPLLFVAVSGIGVAVRKREQYLSEPQHGVPFVSSSLQPRIFRIAKNLGGAVTVSDVVVEAGLSAQEAEQQLQEMTDGLRVRMEIGEDGVIRYVFTELLRRQ